MLPRFVKPHIKDFVWHPDRMKSHGRMYGGHATAEINGVKIGLELWFHGGDEHTTEQLIEHLTIKFVNGKDAGWHAVWDEDSVWFHEKGWFGFDDEAKLLRESIPQVNHNFFPRTFDENKMRELGFVKLVG